jgi:subtilisin family serine protease
MSFSLEENSDVLKKAIADAHSRGIAIVSSVGNDSIDAADSYPAAYSQVLGVAATDFQDRRAPFSNYGKEVSISAPGSYVISTVPGGRYAAAWGTSFSSPLVAGALALLRSSGTPAQSTEQRVMTTADSIDLLNPSFEKKLGKGRVNIYRSLKTKN